MLEKIKTLREKTGISIAECRAALEASGNDLKRALEELRKRGEKNAEKKSSRALRAGVVASYIHQNRALGALVAVFCETDFVAKNPEFIALANDLAMQVAAFAPSDTEELLAQPFVRQQEIPVSEVIKGNIQKFGENIAVTHFERLALE